MPQAYAFAFFAIPALRWLINQRRNAAIEERNEARMLAARILNAFKGDKVLSEVSFGTRAALPCPEGPAITGSW